MKVLALDSSGLVASVAVVCDDRLLGEYTINYKKTHSQTLLPMLQQVADMIELDLQTVDAIAVAAGPGSFTGLRIGSATAKGMGLALGKPIIPVPTVDALAWNLWGSTQLICPLMDARRSQVYTGLYEFKKFNISRKIEAEHSENYLTCDNELADVDVKAPRGSNPNPDAAENSKLSNGRPANAIIQEEIESESEMFEDNVLSDGKSSGNSASVENVIHCGDGWIFRKIFPACAIGIDELIGRINELKRSVIFLGDGVPVYRDRMEERIDVAHSYAPPMSSLQRAASVGTLGILLYKEGHYEDAASHRPDYLRPSQAEREFEGKQRDFRV